MNLNIKKMTLILAVMLLSVQLINADDSQNNVKSEKTEIVNLFANQGANDGKQFGENDGKLAAQADFYAKLKPMWERRYPTSKEISQKYHLQMLDDYYVKEFKYNYRIAYQLAYHTEYLKNNFDNVGNSEQNVAEDTGKIAGESMGASRAAMDIMKNKKDDWEKSYNEFIQNNDLVLKYNLFTEDQVFIDKFLNAFKIGYKKSYTQKYQETQASDIKSSLNAVLFNRNGGEMSAISKRVSVANSSIGSKPTGANYLYVDKNTVMQDTYFGMEIIQNTDITKNSKLLSLDNPIKIYVDNDNQKVKLYKPIYFGLEYSGNHKGGIYQYDGYKWLYQVTNLVDSSVKNTDLGMKSGYAVLKIDDENYSGGVYNLMFDEDYNYPRDAWESDLGSEIIALYKRNYVPQTFEYGYNNSMTKLEYADMLYNAYRYKTLYTEKPVYIANQNAIKGHEAQVQFALAVGYLKLNDKNQFEANSYVSYDDLNFLVKKHINSDYTYKNIADELKLKKFYDSNYNKNVNGNAKKDEIAYTIIKATKIR